MMNNSKNNNNYKNERHIGNEDESTHYTSHPSAPRTSVEWSEPYGFPPLARHFGRGDVTSSEIQPRDEFSSHQEVDDLDFDVFPSTLDACDPYPEAEVTRCCAVVGPEYDYQPFSTTNSAFPYNTTDSFMCAQRMLELPSSKPFAVHLPPFSHEQTAVCTLHLCSHEIMDSWGKFICQLPAEVFAKDIIPGVKYQQRAVVYQRNGPLYCCLSLFAALGNAVAVVMRREDGCTCAFNDLVSDFVGHVTSMSPAEGHPRPHDELHMLVPVAFEHDSTDWSWIDDDALDLHLIVVLADQASSVLPLKNMLEHRTEELISTTSPCDASALCELLVKLDLLDTANSGKIAVALSDFFARCGEFGQLQTLVVFHALAPISHETLDTLKNYQASDLVNERLQGLVA
eukprot:GEMP01015390.1.p1 GENE.GEMP01015390.1~~GEMP01015390.1.p1  ORF type:complete len:399 (+),score=95.20 GEMP01015390.1:47-1243(+)